MDNDFHDFNFVGHDRHNAMDTDNKITISCIDNVLDNYTLLLFEN